MICSQGKLYSGKQAPQFILIYKTYEAETWKLYKILEKILLATETDFLKGQWMKYA